MYQSEASVASQSEEPVLMSSDDRTKVPARDHGLPAEDLPSVAGGEDDTRTIKSMLAEMGDGPRAVARRRDLVELYNKLKGPSETGSGEETVLLDNVAELKAELLELREAMRGIEGTIHITLDKSVENAVRNHLASATEGARRRNARRNWIFLVLVTALALTGAAYFLVLSFKL